MKIAFLPSAPSTIATPLLVVAVADTGGKTPAPELLSSDPALLALAAPLIASADLTGKFAEPIWLLSPTPAPAAGSAALPATPAPAAGSAALPAAPAPVAGSAALPATVAAQRILFLGAGKRDKFCLPELRKLAGAAARAAKSRKIKSFALVLPTLVEAPAAAQAAAEGIIAADFDVDTYRSDRKDLQLTEATLLIPPTADANPVERAIAEGVIVAESQNLTRALALEPSNLMTPTILAERARAMCAETGLACEVYGPAKIKELKMGAFWSVAQGSEEEPRLVVMRYEPAGAPTSPVLGLVGKGITFDTGGISIKPADGMEKMKYDMCGAATMIGAMRAIALLQPNLRVIAILCCTENMPDGKATKPGDVAFAMNGKSVEIINTDAEGRLVLADGLCYARQLGATHLIDAATLTGAVVVALGYHNVGIFANDEELANNFLASTLRTGEKMWRMPLDSEYFEQIPL